MSLKNVDIDSALRRLADRRIDDAIKEGKFDNLRGKGEPIELDDAPVEENASMLWWALRILRNNDVVPDEVRLRKSIDQMKGELATSCDESRIKTLVGLINRLVTKLNTLGTNAMSSAAPMSAVDIDHELQRCRQPAGGGRS